MNSINSNIYSNELIQIIKEYMAASCIQQYAIKMFYKKYGCNWKYEIDNYESNLDYYCYLNNIYDPFHDYINYYYNNN